MRIDSKLNFELAKEGDLLIFKTLNRKKLSKLFIKKHDEHFIVNLHGFDYLVPSKDLVKFERRVNHLNDYEELGQ